jgi:hypothetical protein
VHQSRVILDASARRFQAQKVYLRATAAVKWINRRKQIVPNGKKPTNGQLEQLSQAETAMRAVCSFVAFFIWRGFIFFV